MLSLIYDIIRSYTAILNFSVSYIQLLLTIICKFDITIKNNMFLRFTSTLLLVISYSTLIAQLPNGSEAPDFNLTDLNGEMHNLYEILDDDKSMIIDFSATWCGNCWNYHQTNSLDNVYDMYGPEGTDKTRVLWIEADANTSAECITNSAGCTGSSIGDWTNGSNHPYIDLNDDNFSVKSDYNINSFPTIIGIAPNKKMYNIGKLTNMNTWDSWINETFALDYTATVGIDAIDLDVIAGSGTISYEWSNGETSQDLTNLDPGIYSCTITEGRGHSIETMEYEITASSISINCPPSISSDCSISDIQSYSSIEDFTNAGGQFAGEVDPASFVLVSESSDELSCPETVTRIYSIGDSNGLVAECSQMIIINDTEAPSVTILTELLIPESELEASKINTFEDLQAIATELSDNCGFDQSSLLFIEETASNTICNEITRTYEIQDLCGNSTTFDQTIFIELGTTAELSYTYDNIDRAFSFEANSNFDDIIETYYWDFGDSQNSPEENPNIEFLNYGIFNVCLTVSTQNCGDKTTCTDVEVKMDVATEIEQFNDILIYPNPVHDQISIISTSKNLKILSFTIFDIKGNSVLEYDDHIQLLSLEDLESGIYVIKVQTSMGIYTHKIVKL